MTEIAKLTGIHAHTYGNLCSLPIGECSFAPVAHNGLSRCMCGGYRPTTVDGFCRTCGAGMYADWEWEDVTGRAGFVETAEPFADIPDAPVTVTVHTLDGKSFPVPSVREDSLGMENRNGVPLLVFERHGSDALGYVPNVAYWVTITE